METSVQQKDVADPETQALKWITRLQGADGSFPTEEYLPREIGTAVVMGLLASATSDGVNLEPVLAHSIKYFESRQSPDGAFRYSQCPDVAMNTSLTLLAFFACRDRDHGSYRNDGGYVEVFDPRLLHGFFSWAKKDSATWDGFLEQRPSGPLAADPDRPEPEDLFRAARRAAASKDTARALEIRSRIVLGQGADGSWEVDGPSNGRRIIAAAYRIRTLELLRPLLKAETLVLK